MLIVLSCFTVTAAWYFVFGGNLTASVYSLNGINQVIIPFSNMELNTTTSSNFASTSASFIYNKQGNFSVEIFETFVDSSGGECLDGVSDCQMEYGLYKGNNILESIWNGKKISIPNNKENKVIFVNMSCAAYSCPQERHISIRLNETK